MYVKMADAAEYCGYSETQFKRLSAKYSIPAFGPMKNRYRVEDLDAFMSDPDSFKAAPAPRRRSGSFTPVVV